MERNTEALGGKLGRGEVAVDSDYVGIKLIAHGAMVRVLDHRVEVFRLATVGRIPPVMEGVK